MPGKTTVHGFVIFGFVLFGLFAARAQAQSTRDSPTRVRTQSFDVAYRVNEAALPLDSVQLWYTRDGAKTWELFGADDDRQSPVTFHAAGEGLVGFFFVLTNATGASSAAPADGTDAHHWAMVDYTVPVVQLHPLRATAVMGERVIQVRWTAIDTQLAQRPIRLEYRLSPDATWVAASREPLANTGRFDWRIPTGVSGPVAMRVTVTDLGDNRIESGEQSIEASTEPAPVIRTSNGPAAMMGSHIAVDDSTIPGSRRARQRIEELLAEAEEHRKSGDNVRGIARLREAIRLDPHLTDAFTGMASMLRTVGDHDRALNAYDIALKQRPAMRDALLGSALVLRDQKKYGAAAERLRTVLRYDAKDAESWMNLGDVAIFQGDELLALECYTRATQIDPTAEKIIVEATERLAMMSKSATFRGSND